MTDALSDGVKQPLPADRSADAKPMTDREAEPLTDDERKGYRYGKSGSHTVLEEFQEDGEDSGWYTMATLHEPDENRTGERLVEALSSGDEVARLREIEQAARGLQPVFEEDDNDEQDCRICGIVGHDPTCIVRDFCAALEEK